MTIGKGFVTQTAFKKHLDGDWRTVHELWSHVRNYMTSYPAPADTTYTKTEVDAFFEGYSGGKAQVDAGNVVGLTQGSIPFADSSGFLTEDNPNWFWDDTNNNLGLGTTSFGANMVLGMQIKTGTAPTGNVADTFAFYSKDFAGGNACPYFRTEDGTVIGLNQGLLTTDSPTYAALTISGAINNMVVSVVATDNYVLSDVVPPNLSGAARNICIGAHAGDSITSGDDNIYIGYEAGKLTTTGGKNFAAGWQALYTNISGVQNVCIGYQANAGGTGSNNFALGYYALRSLSTGSENVAIGTQALQYAGATSFNTAIGMAAGVFQSTGQYNVYIGWHAGEYDDGDRNTFIGVYAGGLNGTGIRNTGVGYGALYGVVAGVSQYNTAIGYLSGLSMNAGDNNTLIGAHAGESITTGDGSVCIGYQAGKDQLTTGDNQLWIANSNTATPLIYGEFDNAYLLINGRLAVAFSTIGDDERGLSSIHTLSDNPAKSDGIGFYSEGHIGTITTDGPTYGAGIWLNIDAGATLGADVRALDIGIYEAGATCDGVNAYGLAIHMEFDDTDPPAAIYPFRINCNDTPGHATPAALIFAPNRSAIALTDAAPGTADAYLKIVLQDGSVYRIPLVKE